MKENDNNDINYNDMNDMFNENNINKEAAGDYLNFMDSLKASGKSRKEQGEDLMTWIFSDLLYSTTIKDLQIKDSNDFYHGLEHLCDKGYEKECKFYAYILNHYFPGKMDELMKSLIEKEEYEKCSSLIKYKDIKNLPLLER